MDLDRFKRASNADRLDIIKTCNNTGDAETALAWPGLSAPVKSGLKAQLKALRACEAAQGDRAKLAELTDDAAIAARPGCLVLLSRLIREAQ